MSWFLFSLLSVFAVAGAELTQQHLLNIKNPISPRTSAVLTFLFQSLLTIPIIILLYGQTEILAVFHPSLIYKLIVVTIVGSFAMIFYLKSFRVKNISLSTIFVSSSVVVATILGIIFFKESTSFVKFLGILLILSAIISLNFKNISLEKNHYFGLLAGLLFGVAYTFDKSIVGSIPPLIYIFWAFLLIAIFGFLFNPKEVINSIKGKKLNVFKPIIISGIGYFLFNLFTFNAYVFGGEVGRVDAINNSQVFLIILFEYFILKHLESVKRKVVTAIIAFSGVFILGFY